MVMNRPLRKATRGRLFFLRYTSEPSIRGRGRSVCRISLNSMSFAHRHPHAHARNPPVCPPVGGRPGCKGKIWPVPACGKVFLGRDCDCDVRPGRQEWDERRAEGRVTTIVCGAMRSE
ncbi:hypothetical protein TcCL_NonESM11794 [Trypanosoma cruzi]|nr:hypothetical protein TcCL_NonESM11794 [Trypanosoma cruzi]